MSRGLITLTTDFGSTDHFAGVMKGVILGIAPSARIVDITHEVTPFAVQEAAFAIAQAWRYFPKGSIHVVVVDPGVGSERRPILVEASGQRFIGPDNGVFSLIYDAGPHKVREITSKRVMLKHVSRTFHGRDVFAPAAAHLSQGVKPSTFGKLVRDYVVSPQTKPAQIRPHCWLAQVLKIDRFGNLITNLHIDQFAGIKTRPFVMKAGREQIRRLALTYSDTAPGELSVMVGSSGYLEIAANQESAAEKLGCGVGASIELEFFYD